MSWKVGAVMSSEVVSVRPDTPFKECVEMVRLHRVGALPVVAASGDLLGILTESDLLRKEEVKSGMLEVRGTARVAKEAMTRAVVTVDPTTAVAQAARIMHECSVRHLPVTDSGGRLVGIVSRADLLKVFLRTDESIRREVEEEVLPRTFGIQPGAVEVAVRQGIVHLDGEVETSNLARLIPDFVDRVEGVVGVENHLQHRWDDSRPVPAGQAG